MAVTASSISSSNTLEQLRTQFNNLVTDVTGLEAGSQTFTLITSSNITVAEDGTIVFEGATNDDNETTLTVVDPTADRTIYLPNQSGYLPVLAAVSTTQVSSTPEELNILDEIINAAPTDGLWDDGRTDEGQLGLKYDELEEAMNDSSNKNNKKYLEIRKRNLHKMNPIPVCKMKDE